MKVGQRVIILDLNHRGETGTVEVVRHNPFVMRGKYRVRLDSGKDMWTTAVKKLPREYDNHAA